VRQRRKQPVFRREARTAQQGERGLYHFSSPQRVPSPVPAAGLGSAPLLVTTDNSRTRANF
jgi:hypothetical protein